MARIRSVHPSLFTDEAWVSCCPLARLLYIGLWTDADDQGVFEWKPLQIKMRLLPGDAADVASLLAELQAADLVAPFEVGGKRFGAIKSFRKFQRPKKPNSIHPMPDQWRTYVALTGDGSELHADEDGQVPHQGGTGEEQEQQMEDGGGRREDISEANASSVASGEATTWAQDVVFSKAWDACTPEMRRRSKSRTLVWPAWCKAAAEVGPEKLLGALVAFVREGPDIARNGGPGLQTWLEDGRWDAFVREVATPCAWNGPPEIRAHVVKERGEGFAKGYLDTANWTVDGIRPRTRIAFDKLKELRLVDVALLAPESAAA